MKEKYELQGRYDDAKMDFAQLFSEQSVIRLIQCFYWEQNWPRIIYKRTMNRSFFYVVVSGEFTVSTPETGVDRIGPGQILYMPAGQSHTAMNMHCNLVKAYGIHFHWQLPGYRTDARLFSDKILNVPHSDYWNEQLARLTAALNRVGDAAAIAWSTTILRAFLVDLIFTHPTMVLERTDDRVNRVVEMILQNPDRWRDIKDLARQIGLSPSRFRALFHREMNVSPKTYIEKCRLENCANEMLTSNLSIKEISARHGFSSPQYFNQAFKRHLGVAPREYRITHG